MKAHLDETDKMAKQIKEPLELLKKTSRHGVPKTSMKAKETQETQETDETEKRD